jgi:UDP-2,4-diacetamido-2,4,6-trideoxy-beta-L-altropyranose hydrolase
VSTSRAPRIVVVVDAGDTVGWGHFVRSHALVYELRRRGAEVELFVNGVLPPFAAPGAATETGNEMGVVALPPSALNADAVVLDLKTYAARIRADIPDTILLVTIMDGDPIPFQPDLTIDPNVSGRQRVGASLSGPEAVILRPEFDRRPAVSPARMSGTLLVSFGGAPPRELVARTVRAVRNQSMFSDVCMVLPAGIDVAPPSGDSGVRITVSTRVADMHALLLQAEAGLIAAGTLLHEACATGLPSAVVSLNEEQHVEAAAVAGRRAILYLGPSSDLTDDALGSGLTSLASPRLRAELSSHALALLGGHGRERVAELIVEHVVDRRDAPPR